MSLSQNQLASVLDAPPFPAGSIAEGDLEQALGLFRLDDAPAGYDGNALTLHPLHVFCPGFLAAVVRC